jgi:hypothetical protein
MEEEKRLSDADRATILLAQRDASQAYVRHLILSNKALEMQVRAGQEQLSAERALSSAAAVISSFEGRLGVRIDPTTLNRVPMEPSKP